MGVAVGLGVGVGLLLIWSAFALPPSRRRIRSHEGAMQRLLARAGLSGVTQAGLIGLCLLAGIVVTAAVLLISRTLPVAAVFGLIAAYSPVAALNGRARRRQREFAEVWPEAVDNLTSGVRAGLSLPEALSGLAVRGPEPLRHAFAAFALDYQVTGRFGDSLDSLKQRLADPVGDRVVEGLRVARDVGGGELGRLLRALSAHLREDARTRSELEARQSWTINGARLAVAAPWLVLLLLAFQPEVIQRYSTPTGTAILLVGAGVCWLAYRLMMRIGRLPVERRILS